MSKKPTYEASGLLEGEFLMRLTEKQARALYHLSKWSAVDSTKVLGEKVSMDFRPNGPHHVGLVEVISNAGHLGPILRRFDDARDVFAGNKEVRDHEEE